MADHEDDVAGQQQQQVASQQVRRWRVAALVADHEDDEGQQQQRSADEINNWQLINKSAFHIYYSVRGTNRLIVIKLV